MANSITEDITILPSDGNGTHWTVAQNLRQMQVSDDAFIARDLAKFNHHPNSTMYYPMGVVMNLSEHLQDMRLTFSSFSDAAPHNHNYRVSFGEGDWTVAIARAAGTNDGPLADATGALLPPTRRTVNYDLMTISRWNAGLMMEEHLWTDNPRLFRLLGLLPSPPPVDIPDIELNPHTAPLSTIPGVDSSTSNKAKVNKANAAFNNVKFDAESLHLSSNLTVYGLDDQPYDLQAYMRFLNQYKTAFPDLHIENNQIIAQGDWVATISMLSGTHQGPLTLPLYLSSSPIQATGKKFNLLHYTISRWQNGEIVEMRVNLDLFGILVALGISF
jgi:predicted ester cyclase